MPLADEDQSARREDETDSHATADRYREIKFTATTYDETTTLSRLFHHLTRSAAAFDVTRDLTTMLDAVGAAE